MAKFRKGNTVRFTNHNQHPERTLGLIITKGRTQWVLWVSDIKRPMYEVKHYQPDELEKIENRNKFLELVIL